MRPKLRVALVVGAFAGMVIWLGYLHHRVNTVVVQSWDEAVQSHEQTLRRVGAVEMLLRGGQVDDAVVELQHIRQHTLTSLSGITIHAPEGDTRVREYALRVFCGETPVELRPGRNGGEMAGNRMILATQQLCGRAPGGNREVVPGA